MRVFWLGRIEDEDHLFFEHPFSIKVKSHSKKNKEKKSLKVKPWCLLDILRWQIYCRDHVAVGVRKFEEREFWTLNCKLIYCSV